jgi:hypothetical protein
MSALRRLARFVPEPGMGANKWIDPEKERREMSDRPSEIIRDAKNFSRSVELAKEQYRRDYGVDIAVVDDSDLYGFAASALRIGEVYMSDVKSMVANVLKKKGRYKIRRLDMVDHGNKLWFQVGKDSVGLHRQLNDEQKKMVKDLSEVTPEFLKLRPEFEHWGFVHLQHCHIGLNKDLIVAVAKLLNVSIYAGTDYHRAAIRRQDGDYMRADPNGAYYQTGRPDQDSHMTYIGMRPEDPAITGSREELSVSFRYSAHEDYPPPTDYYLENILAEAAKAKYSRKRDRIAVTLMTDFSKGVPSKSNLARELYARLSKRVRGDRLSMMFNTNLNSSTRAALLGVLLGKL